MSRSDTGDEQVGELIRRLRKEHDLTQEELARRVSCSRSLIQQIENGTRVPPFALRERLSAALGERLLTGEEADSDSDLRMRFNVLLGRDPMIVDRALALAQSLLDAAAVPEEIAPLRDIADRQLERAEEVLSQIPSGTAHVGDWNTITDWMTVLNRAKRVVRTTHTADLNTIGGAVGEGYHAEILRLAAAGVAVRRLYVLDGIEAVFPHEDRLWDQVRAGVETVLIARKFAPNAQGVLIVDNSYVVTAEYDLLGRIRIETHFSSLKHDVQYAIRRFDSVFELTSGGTAVVVNEVLEQAPLDRYRSLDHDDCRAVFREALTQAWNRAAGGSQIAGARP